MSLRKERSLSVLHQSGMNAISHTVVQRPRFN